MNGRLELARIFKEQKRLDAYEALIESAINIRDDGIGIEKDEGLTLTSTGASRKLLSFYDAAGGWSIGLNPSSSNGLYIRDKSGNPGLFFQEGGNVGIGTETPEHRLEVNGVATMHGMAGTYSVGYSPADGDWHSLERLDGIPGGQAFEVIAHINDEEDGRFALSQAVAWVPSNGTASRGKIRKVTAGSRWLWGKYWNKITFRWKVIRGKKGEPGGYRLQMKTRTHFGEDDEGNPKQVFYRVTKLWGTGFEQEAVVEEQRIKIQAD